MKKILSPSFIKYFLAGISSVILDFSTLIAIKNIFIISATMAVAINQVLIWVYNFSINKYWTFNNRKLPHKQFAKYMILVGFNYLFSIIIMYIFSDIMGSNYLIVRFFSIAIITLWNYYLYKSWVYV